MRVLALLVVVVGCTSPNQFSAGDPEAADAAGPAGEGGAAGMHAAPAPDAAADRTAPADAEAEDRPGIDHGEADSAPADGPALVADGPAPIADGPVADLPAQKLAAGATCRVAGECLDGHCVDNVCCSSACAGKCSACASKHTGMPDGTCAPVMAGADPHDDCQAGDPTQCKLDGACDGKGACRLHAAGTPCRTEHCDDGGNGSTHTPAAACDGKGTCAGPNPASCGLFVCGTNACKKKCATAGDCIGGNYCDSASGACVKKKGAGAVCGGKDECAAGTCGGACGDGTCGGRCCVGCTCPQPSAGNLLANPGFDKDLSGWTLTLTPNDGSQKVNHQTLDANDCPYSGSVGVHTQTSNALLAQCRPATQGKTYYYGGFARANLIVAEWQAYCGVAFYPSMSACASGSSAMGKSVLRVDQAILNLDVWASFAGQGTAPAGTAVVGFSCEALDDYAGDYVLTLDNLYLSEQPRY